MFALFLLGEAADLALVLFRLFVEDLAPFRVDHVSDDMLGRFAEDFARFDAALRADDHLHAARERLACPRAQHAQVSHNAVSDNVLRHELRR